MTPPRRAGRGLLLAWLHLAVLWAFAIAQPLFDVLRRDPAFFVARANTAGDIVLFAFALVLIPPTVGVAVEATLVRAPAAQRLVHLALVSVFAAALALQFATGVVTDAPSILLLPLCLALGVAFGLAYARTRFVPTVLTVLGPAPLLFLALFLLVSDVSKLVFPKDHEEARAAFRSRPPVVFVLFDEFSGATLLNGRGRIDAVRFPHFAALARDATWFRNATTVADQTTRAVPAMLTGRRSQQGKIPIVGDYPDNLFTLLGDTYDLDVHESASQLCPERLCQRERDPFGERIRSLAHDLTIVSLRGLLPEELAENLPAVSRTFGNFAGGAQVNGSEVAGRDTSAPPARGRTFERFAAGIGPQSSGVLHFMHIQLPHVPWQFLPSGQLYPDNGLQSPGLDATNDLWTTARWPVEQAFQRYRLQAGYADRLLGDVLSRLKATGIYDRAMVVVAADHGVAFRPGKPRRRVTSETFPDLASVPLFVKVPKQRNGGAVEAHAETIDVLPTIADVLGVDLPWRVDGRSLLAGGRRIDEVAVSDPTGRVVREPVARFRRERSALVRTQEALFGSAQAAGGAYAMRADRPLIGRDLRTFTVGARGRGRADLDAPQAYGAVDPRAVVVPAFVTAHLSGVPAGRRLVVALNGRVAGVGRSFVDGGRTVFASVVSPGALSRGRNRIDVLTVDDDRRRPTLTPLEVAVETYALTQRDGQEVVTTPEGKNVRVRDGELAGSIETLDLRGGGLVVKGWAGIPNRAPANLVLVFAGGRLVASGVPDKARPDVAHDQGAALQTSGYELSGGLSGISGAPRASSVRVIGIYGDQASELKPVPNLKVTE